MARKLTKAGLPMTRNLAKPWRPQRFDVKKDQIHWADNMRLGSQGQHVNSTGCVGLFGSSFIRTKVYGPRGGRRREGKPKKRNKLISTHDLLHLDDVAIKKYTDVRLEIIKVKVIEEFLDREVMTQALKTGLEKLTRYIRNRVNNPQWEYIKDRQVQYEDSIWGNLEKNGVGRLDLRKLNKKVNFITSKL